MIDMKCKGAVAKFQLQLSISFVRLLFVTWYRNYRTKVRSSVYHVSQRRTNWIRES